MNIQHNSITGYWLSNKENANFYKKMVIQKQTNCFDWPTLLYEESGDELDRKKACYFRNPGSDGLNWETLISSIFILIWDLDSEGTNWQQYNREMGG